MRAEYDFFFGGGFHGLEDENQSSIQGQEFLGTRENCFRICSSLAGTRIHHSVAVPLFKRFGAGFVGLWKPFLTDNIARFQATLDENNGPLRTTLDENETTLIENRPRISGLDHITENS